MGSFLSWNFCFYPVCYLQSPVRTNVLPHKKLATLLVPKKLKHEFTSSQLRAQGSLASPTYSIVIVSTMARWYEVGLSFIHCIIRICHGTHISILCAIWETVGWHTRCLAPVHTLCFFCSCSVCLVCCSILAQVASFAPPSFSDTQTTAVTSYDL